MAQQVLNLGPYHGATYQPDYSLQAYRNGNPAKPISDSSLDLRSAVAIQTSKSTQDLSGTFQITLKDKRARSTVREMDTFRIRLRGHHSQSLITVMKGVVDGVRPVGSSDPHGSREDTVIHGRCSGKYLQVSGLFLPVWDPDGALPTALTFGIGDVTQKGSPTYNAGGTTPFDIFDYLIRQYTYGEKDLVGVGGIPNSKHWLDHITRFAKQLGFNVPFLQLDEDSVAIALKALEVIGFTESWVDELGRIVYRRPQWDAPVKYRLSTADLTDWEFPRTDEQTATYVEVIPAGDPGIDSAISQALRAGRAPVPSSYVKAGGKRTELGKYVSDEFIIDTDKAGKPTSKGRTSPWYQRQRRLGLRAQQITAPLLATQEQAQATSEGLLRFFARMDKGLQFTIPGTPELRLGYTVRVDGELEGEPFDRSGYTEQISHSYVETPDGGSYTTTCVATHGRDARDPFTGKPDPAWGRIVLPKYDPADLATNPGTLNNTPGNSSPSAAIPGIGDLTSSGQVASVPVNPMKSISSSSDHKSRPLHNWQSDNAVDLSGKKGQACYAVDDGTISSSFGFGPSTGGPTVYGYRLHLETRSNVWFYQHMDRFAPGIKPGAKVKAGDTLGYIGDSRDFNKGTIPTHLHLGVKNGTPETLLGLS